MRRSKLLFEIYYVVLTRFITVSLARCIAAITADIIALAVAWKKAVGTVRQASRLNIRMPLSKVLIEDGKNTSITITRAPLTQPCRT